jgi:hypothetical protein
MPPKAGQEAKLFSAIQGGEPNNSDTGLRRYDAGRFNKRNRLIRIILERIAQ